MEDGLADGSFHPTTKPWVIAYGILGMVAWSNRWFNPETSPVPAAEIGGAANADTVLVGLTRTTQGETP